MAYPSMNKTYAQVKYNVSRRSAGKAGVKYCTIHYTGTTASAKNNCIYFSTGNRGASADYFVDVDGSIWKFNKDCKNYYTWHCNDGHGMYGITNANSIGIEVVSAGKAFTKEQKEALRKLVTAIMADFSIPVSRVVRHYDASRKICPAAYCGNDKKNIAWAELRKFITTKPQAVAPAKPAQSKPVETKPVEVKPAPAPKPVETEPTLTVDGILGVASVKELQKQLKVKTVNGKVAGQKASMKKYVLAGGSNWSFNNGKGAPVVKALQKKVGATADGYVGPDTVKRLQKFVGVPQDGYLGKDTAKAVQKALNGKKFQ